MNNTEDVELRALLDEFVLFTDNTPYSNEPTELSVYLRQCGFDDAMDRLEKELTPLIQQEASRQKIELIDRILNLPDMQVEQPYTSSKRSARHARNKLRTGRLIPAIQAERKQLEEDK